MISSFIHPVKISKCSFIIRLPESVRGRSCKCVVSFKNLFFSVQGGCGGIFKKAAHCWPFNREVEFNKSPDLRGGFPAMLKASAGRM